MNLQKVILKKSKKFILDGHKNNKNVSFNPNYFLSSWSDSIGYINLKRFSKTKYSLLKKYKIIFKEFFSINKEILYFKKDIIPRNYKKLVLSYFYPESLKRDGSYEDRYFGVSSDYDKSIFWVLIPLNKINKKIKVVVACGNGTAGVFAPEILRNIGCDVIELDCKLDWTFPKYNPNPEDLEMLHAITKAVKDNNADIGFGFDGDGDRCGVIDDKGNEIYSDKIGLLIARHLSNKHKNSKFVVDVKSTGLYLKDKVLLENQCKTIYWKTGHSHIKRKVNLEKALAGFEKSGHFFFNQPLGYGYDDGINSAIQVCHLLDNQNKKLSEIMNDLPKTYQTPTMAPFCKDEEKYKVVEDVVNKIQQLKKENIKIDNQSITDVLTVNGIRFSLEDGSWGLIRASSNKPSLVVVTESPSSDERKKSIFNFIDNLLQKTGKIGEYDQKI